MRVLMVVFKFPPYFAGAAVQAVHLAKSLQMKGVSVRFITGNDHRETVHDSWEGLPVFRFSTLLKKKSKIKDFIYVFQLMRYLILFRHDYDIVHLHSMGGIEFFVFPLCKILKKKVILKVTLVDNDDPLAFSRRKMGLFINWGFRFLDRFVVISTALRDRCLQAGHAPGKVPLIYNGVNTEKFFPAEETQKNKLREAFGFSGYRKIFLSIGKVEFRKGYDLLIDAWPKIAAAFPESALIIVGPGVKDSNPYYLDLVRKIKAASIQNVYFLNHIDDVSQYMRFADCFLFCSRAEGFGTVVIEAMSAEVPVVAMNIPGVTEDIIKDPRIGRICYSLKPDDFAQDVIELMSQHDPESIRQASLRVRSEFAIEKIADSYIRLYEQLLSSK